MKLLKTMLATTILVGASGIAQAETLRWSCAT